MDLGQAVVNAAASLVGPAWTLLWSLCGLIGVLYGGAVMMRAHRASQMVGQPMPVSQLVMLFLIAGVITNLSKLLNAASNTVGLGDVSYGPIAYAPAAALGPLGQVINACLTLGSIAGGWFAFKGMLLMKRATADGHGGNSGEDIIWRAMTHLFFGATLVNIPKFIDAARATIGLMY